MQFKEKDLVVITGYIKKSNTRKSTAKIFEVLFVGLHELVVTTHLKNSITSPRTFKVQKSACTKITHDYQAQNKKSIVPKIGSLVLCFVTDWRGKLTNKFVGHIEEIHQIPGDEKTFVVATNNETKEVKISSLLLLEE